MAVCRCRSSKRSRQFPIDQWWLFSPGRVGDLVSHLLDLCTLCLKAVRGITKSILELELNFLFGNLSGVLKLERLAGVEELRRNSTWDSEVHSSFFDQL